MLILLAGLMPYLTKQNTLLNVTCNFFFFTALDTILKNYKIMHTKIKTRAHTLNEAL